MSSTTLIKKIKNNSLVVFKSAINDFNYFLNSKQREIKFSHFVLMDIPEIATSTNNINSIQFQNIEGAFIGDLSTATPEPEGDRVDLSQSIQNYMLNFEALVLNDPGYNTGLTTTTSERIFFKWLKEIGAIRFKEETVNKASTQTNKRFSEQDQVITGANQYKKIVKYVGEIDMQGGVKSGIEAFKEIYIYIPTVVGSTPTIMFKNISDANYEPDRVFKKADTPNAEFILGRDGTDISTTGLSFEAIYDKDVDTGDVDYVVNGGAGTIWTDSYPDTDAYLTEPVEFDNPNDDTITRTNPSTSETVTYKRSKLDGITLDFDKASYKAFELDPDLDSFNEFNKDGSGFDYNTIALYYDIIENGVKLSTNLFGFMVVGDLKTVSIGSSKLEVSNKFVPNPITGQQGNGYGVRLNIGLNGPGIQQGDIFVSINDYNTFSMQLFAETMQKINLASNNFTRIITEFTELKSRISEVESNLFTTENVGEVQTEIDFIKTQLSEVTPNVELLKLINANSKLINQILSGTSKVPIELLLELRSLDGLSMALENNILTLRNKRQKYGNIESFGLYNGPFQRDGLKNTVKLGEYDTLYINTTEPSMVLNTNIEFFIDDTINKWKTGQSFTFKTKNVIGNNGYNISFFTDFPGIFGESKNKFIGEVSGFGEKPEIEVICIDENNYKFEII